MPGEGNNRNNDQETAHCKSGSGKAKSSAWQRLRKMVPLGDKTGEMMGPLGGQVQGGAELYQTLV